MRYPVVISGDVRAALAQLEIGSESLLEVKIEERGTGERIDVEGLCSALAITAPGDEGCPAGLTGLDRDQVEGAMSLVLYEALEHVPVGALDDPDFWAYVATGPLWPFVQWREPLSSRKLESYLLYIDGKSSTECVPLRMFLRARALRIADVSELASAIPDAVDFWRSHVLRVRTGSHPRLVRAVAQQQFTDRMSTGPLRAYARRVNRRWSNEILYLLDDYECDELARVERQGL
jgi:hypothetical protein